MQTDLTVTTSKGNILAPAACRSVRIQQKQGSDPPSIGFHIYDPTGLNEIAPSPYTGGCNVLIAAPAGTMFAAGAVVGQIASNTGSPSSTFTVFADPVVAFPNVYVGDAGSGGGAGIVPAAAAGDSALVKRLAADGTWVLGTVTRKTLITSAQLLAIQTTGIVLAPAIPGVINVPIKITLRYKFVGTAYTLGNADNQFRLQYVGDTTALSAALAAAALVDQVANRTLHALMVALAAKADSVLSGIAIELKLAVGTTPALTLGDGTLEATLQYAPVIA